MALTILPNAGQNLNQTRDPIRNNFASINAAFNINHVDFGLGDQGKHKWVSMPTQVADPVTTATETAIYTKTVGGILDLFFRRANNGSVYNVTKSDIATAGSNNIALSAGYTYLPSGMLLKWGRALAAAPFPGGFKTITFPVVDNGGAAIPAFTNNLGGLVCPVSDLTHFVGLNSYTAIDFALAVGSASANLTFMYFFIGY